MHFLERVIPWPLMIFLLAALTQLVYWDQTHGTALNRWHDWDQSDMHSYLEQSRRLAGGDWLAREPFHPYHLWQRFASPEKWQQWYRPGVFHQAPGYSYLLAAARSLTLYFIKIVKLLQFLLGACTAVLIYMIARRMAGLGAGIIAGVLAALHGPLIYVEAQILKEGISIFLMLAGLIALQDGLDGLRSGKPGKKALACLALAGWLTGLLIVFHEMGRVVLAAAVLTIVWVVGLRIRRRLPAAMGVFMVGVLLGIGPLVARNLIVGAPPLALSSRMAVVFAMSNDPEAASGGSVWGKVSPRLVELLDAAQTRPGGVFTAVREAYNGDLRLFLYNWLLKVEALCLPREAPDNTSYAFFASRVGLLRFLPNFWFIFAPGLAGFALALARMIRDARNKKKPDSEKEAQKNEQESASSNRWEPALVFYFLGIAGSLTLIHAIGRLRLFAVPFLIVFSAQFLVALGAALRQSPRPNAAGLKIAGAVFFLAAFFQAHAWAAHRPYRLRAADFVVAANLERATRQWRRAAEDYGKAIELGYRDSAVYFARGQILMHAKMYDEAHRTLMEGLERIEQGADDHQGLKRTLAWLMATCPIDRLRNGALALELAREVNAKSGGQNVRDLDVLAAAQAETGDFAAAIETAERAIEQSRRLQMIPLIAIIERRLQGYRQNHPYREPIL